MKIHWLSNSPLAGTGYGNQTKLFATRLQKAGHEISITCFFGHDGYAFKWNGITLYPKGYQPYGQDVVAANAHHEHADIIISLMDSWVCSPDQIQDQGNRWVPWLPVDMEPLPGPIKTAITPAFRRIVYSKFGERMLKDAGIQCYYVPHGINTALYCPESKEVARKASGLPADAWIIGMVAANRDFPSRKCFVEQLSAFSNFKRRHKDAVMYLHTAIESPTGLNLKTVVEGLGLRIGMDVFIPQLHRYVLGGFSDQDLFHIFNSFDVLSSVSSGEGFGIPIVEAQACGVPVIVGDWTSMPELLFSGRKVEKISAAPTYTPLGTFQFIPRIDAIEALYHAEFKKPSSKAAARAGAEKYDADVVLRDYWLPVLSEIESEIK